MGLSLAAHVESQFQWRKIEYALPAASGRKR
jgi:hypothetical protein